MYDLRAEVADDTDADAWLVAIRTDWRGATLVAADRALCAFAERLTREPGAMTAADVAPLREAGFDDTAIHDATQVVSFFNYINRIADALGVEPEAGLPALPGDPTE